MDDAALAGQSGEIRAGDGRREDPHRPGDGAGPAGRPLRLLGVAGRAGSGKSTLARALAARWGFGYLPIASPLKGMALHIAGPLGYFPQWSPRVRELLQDLGTRLRRHDLGVRALTEALAYGDGWVVPDVRYRDELEAIRARGGEVVFVGPDEPGQHASEQLDPREVGLHRVLAPTVRGKIAAVEAYLMERGWELPTPRRPVIYLGGSIWGDEGFLGRQEAVREALAEAGFAVVTHADAGDASGLSAWDMALEGSDLITGSRRLVGIDLAELAMADGGLLLLGGPSVGSAMEVMALALSEKPVAAVVPTTMRAHPWLNALARPFWRLGSALAWLRYVFGLSDHWPTDVRTVTGKTTALRREVSL